MTGFITAVRIGLKTRRAEAEAAAAMVESIIGPQVHNGQHGVGGDLLTRCAAGLVLDPESTVASVASREAGYRLSLAMRSPRIWGGFAPLGFAQDALAEHMKGQ